MALHLHVSTNVGSLGSRSADRLNPNRVVEVRRNVYNVMDIIKQKHGKFPDSVALQETGNHEVRLQPKFGLPIATDAHIAPRPNLVNYCRGVATWGDPASTKAFPPIDNSNEVVTTVHDIVFDSKKGKKSYKVAFINAYALRSKKSKVERSRELKDYILTQVTALRKEGIRKVLVTGDFNDEKFSITGFKELAHPDMGHKHNKQAKAHFIDKVFSNFVDVKIMDVLESCENKDSGLGHKVILLGL